MASFTYKGRNTQGDLVRGVVEAASVDAVATQLLGNNITPIDISEKVEAIQGLNFKPKGSRPGLDDLILFSRQMYTLMRAGVPMVKAMSGLTQSTRNYYMIEAQNDILTNIESGRNLAGSIGMHPEIFSTLFVSMVSVGEETGRLDESFLRIGEYLEREKDTRERIKAALRYPSFVIIAIAIAITIINIWVIPVFAEMFANAGAALPWQTQFLLFTSSIFVNWWHVMLGAIVFSILGFRLYVSTENGRRAWDRYKLKLPFVGDIIKRATLARFARAFSMALTSGVPITQALLVVSRSVDNEYIADYVLDMRNGIERGDSLTRTAVATGMFTPLVMQMMAVGEETGQVDELLGEVADYYEREVDYDIKNLSAAIEPTMILVVGAMVLMLALGVFLPIWDMARVVN